MPKIKVEVYYDEWYRKFARKVLRDATPSRFRPIVEIDERQWKNLQAAERRFIRLLNNVTRKADLDDEA